MAPSSDRRAALLAAARAVLAEKGYTGASMLEIARRARASKETLYSHFGDKRGLFEALILDNAAEVNAALAAALEDGAAAVPERVLPRFCLALQKLLLGEAALVVNRAAIAEAAAEPTLGRLLVDKGRDSPCPAWPATWRPSTPPAACAAMTPPRPPRRWSPCAWAIRRSAACWAPWRLRRKKR